MQSLNHKPLIRRDCSRGVPEVLHNANTRSERQWLVAQDSFHPPKHLHEHFCLSEVLHVITASVVSGTCGCWSLLWLCVLIPSVCGCRCCVWSLHVRHQVVAGAVWSQPAWYQVFVVAGAVCDHCLCDTKWLQVLCVITACVIPSVCWCRCCVW